MATPDGGTTFSFGTRLGLVFIVEFASLSAIAVVSLLLYILYSAVTIKRGASRAWTVSTHVHYYFVNLLLSDLIQAIGAIFNVKWIAEAKVTEGTTCTVQGIFKQIGDVGVALTSLAIATHTLLVLVFRVHSRPRTALVVLAVIWIFIALIVGINMGVHRGQRYYGNTQYWCWITEQYAEERIGLEYLWMWLAAFMNLVCYVLIALVLKGLLVVGEGRIRFRRRRNSGETAFKLEKTQANTMAMQMLFYPLIYIVTVFPIAVVRWLAFDGTEVPFEATTFAAILFSSSGLFNTLLFAWTRPKLLPYRDGTSTAQARSQRSTQNGSNSTPTQQHPAVISPWDNPEYGFDDWKYPYPANVSVAHIPRNNRVSFSARVAPFAVCDLKLQRDKVKQYQKQIQVILDREQAIAKEHLANGQKDRALTALRRRKYQQSLLVKTDGQLESLEQLVSSIEFSLVELSVLHGLKQGNEVLKEIHKEMSVESVEKLLEETAEAREYQREIDEMLANNLTLEDEDAVQAELLELQAQQLKAPEQVPEKDREQDRLPSVPITEPTSPEPKEVASEERVAMPA
ncbi:hypothetical protein WG66_015193 [Moniliophthora roreri]|uniref:Uncharacterized protein n=1 Tax=Moniliophthora roreri TaxID=221103 RepID=A0A0W0FGK8_MONRR|nr:hypothetical protein WG66_015193 [Moniliophthora roreri]